jgi:hypothetical protein
LIFGEGAYSISDHRFVSLLTCSHVGLSHQRFQVQFLRRMTGKSKLTLAWTRQVYGRNHNQRWLFKGWPKIDGSILNGDFVRLPGGGRKGPRLGLLSLPRRLEGGWRGKGEKITVPCARPPPSRK